MVFKAKLQAIAKVVDPVATVDDPVVEVVHKKRRGTLAEAALKLDKPQKIEKLKPAVVRRNSNLFR